MPKINKLFWSIWRTPKIRGDKTYVGSVSRSSRLSSYHPDIAFKLLTLLCSGSSFHIIDPFCGEGVRVLTALKLGHLAIGFDVSPLTIERVKSKNPEYVDHFKVNDSTKSIPVESRTSDLVFSCPPYWILEKYEPSDGQLSRIVHYDDFLVHLHRGIMECNRVLKNDGFLAMQVRNFRHKGKYYPFVFDMMSLIRSSGFAPWDNVIVDHSFTKPFGAKESLENKHTRCSHEEIIIAKKKF